MKAVILAAGEGIRLRPFTHSQPKVMIPVANKPILEHVVDALVDAGVRDIVMVVGYRRESIMSHFEDGTRFGARIEYAVEEKQLGTAHALHVARERIGGEFLVLAGDNLIGSDTLGRFLGDAKAPAMLLTHSDAPSKYGVAVMDGDVVTELQEKPEKDLGNLVCTGTYLLDERALADVKAGLADGLGGIPDVLRRTLPERRLRGVVTEGTWLDAVYPWNLVSLNAAALAEVAGRTAGTVEDGARIKGPVDIGDGTIVRSGAYIVGPVKIGSGCDIGPNAVIYPSTSIGDNTSIGAHATVRNSLVMADAAVGDGCIVEDSVLGRGVRLGPGCAMVSGGATAVTERECHDIAHIGAMVGEDTHAGPLCCFSPGTVVGWGCRISSNCRVDKNLEDRSVRS